MNLIKKKGDLLRNSNNYVLLVSVFFLTVFAIGLIFAANDYGNVSSDYQKTSSNIENRKDDSSFKFNTINLNNDKSGIQCSSTNGIIPNEEDNSIWGYDEWRQYVVFEAMNKTEQELNESITNDPMFQHNIHILTIGTWGYNNGTFTEEELNDFYRENMISHSLTVEIIDIRYATDSSVSFVFEVRIESDVIFQYWFHFIDVYFKSSSPYGKWDNTAYEHVYNDVTLVPIMDPLPGLPAIYYSDTITIYTGSLENNLKIKVKASGWVTFWGGLIPIWVTSDDDIEEVDLIDDDTTTPDFFSIESINFVHDQMIYDCQPYLYIKGVFGDKSFFYALSGSIEGYPSTIVSPSLSQYYFYIPFLGWIPLPGYYNFIYNIPSPRELGDYTAILYFEDADNDRSNDRSNNIIAIDFTIEDDDPHGPAIWEPQENDPYMDDEQIKLPLEISMTDSSGIRSYLIKIGPHTYQSIFDGSTGYPKSLTWSDEVVLEPGVYKLEVWACDNDNDRPNDQKCSYYWRTIIIDLEPPVTELAIDPSYTDNLGKIYVSSDTIFTLVAEDVFSGVAHTYYRINGGPWIEYSDPFTLPYVEGSYLIEYYSVDNLGNTEQFRSITVILDSKPPETQISMDTFYTNNLGKIYVSSDTIFTLVAEDVFSGVAHTYYRINGGPWIEYIDPFTLPYVEGSYLIEYYSVDNLGNTEQFRSITVILDSTPPETQISMDLFHIDESGNVYVSSGTKFSLTATDQGSGEAYTKYRINDGTWIIYNTPFMLPDIEGIYIIDFYSIDNLGITESIHSITVFFDLTPPNTQLDISPYYTDELDNIYVTTETEFTLTPVDDGSGVADTYYRIGEDGEPWLEYCDSFNLGLPDGTYVIFYYSVDNIGNIEEIKSITVNLVSLDMHAYLSDGDLNPISHFDVIFTKDKQDGVTGYKIVATNPGQIFYNIEILNTWPIEIGTLVIYPNIPADFVLKGTNPIHIFLDDVDITEHCIISESAINVPNIPPGSKIHIIIHMEYGLKGTFYAELDDFWVKNYIFSPEIQATSVEPSETSGYLFGMYITSEKLTGYEKKTTGVAGYVTDGNGTPIVGAIVELKFSDGTILTTITDEHGFYYFIDLSAGNYEIKITKDNELLLDWQGLTIVKNELRLLDFIIL